MKNITIKINAHLNNQSDYQALGLATNLEKIVNDYLSRLDSGCFEATYCICDNEGTPIGQIEIENPI